MITKEAEGDTTLEDTPSGSTTDYSMSSPHDLATTDNIVEPAAIPIHTYFCDKDPSVLGALLSTEALKQEEQPKRSSFAQLQPRSYSFPHWNNERTMVVVNGATAILDPLFVGLDSRNNDAGTSVPISDEDVSGIYFDSVPNTPIQLLIPSSLSLSDPDSFI
ncbi:hypothetical protein BD779DRAFT_1801571 [Infundibulicybe gibba]|nr:hypothetical protein BD779DRAFT_1801571 [Infundibulicybe gibba]